MKSKRAAIGSFISNYFSLIFLAIILGVFIFTSPFIKMTVNPYDKQEESIYLNEYKVLFYQAKEIEIELASFEEKFPSNGVFLSANKLPNSEFIYFYFDNSKKLFISIGFEDCPVEEVYVICEKWTSNSDKTCMSYSLVSDSCENFIDKKITPLINLELNYLKDNSYEEQLSYLKKKSYSLGGISYEE